MPAPVGPDRANRSTPARSSSVRPRNEPMPSSSTRSGLTVGLRARGRGRRPAPPRAGVGTGCVRRGSSVTELVEVLGEQGGGGGAQGIDVELGWGVPASSVLARGDGDVDGVGEGLRGPRRRGPGRGASSSTTRRRSSPTSSRAARTWSSVPRRVRRRRPERERHLLDAGRGRRGRLDEQDGFRAAVGLAEIEVQRRTRVPDRCRPLDAVRQVEVAERDVVRRRRERLRRAPRSRRSCGPAARRRRARGRRPGDGQVPDHEVDGVGPEVAR